MEHHHFQWINPLSIVIFNSYVKLPEGRRKDKCRDGRTTGCRHDKTWATMHEDPSIYFNTERSVTRSTIEHFQHVSASTVEGLVAFKLCSVLWCSQTSWLSRLQHLGILTNFYGLWQSLTIGAWFCKATRIHKAIFKTCQTISKHLQPSPPCAHRRHLRGLSPPS